jgi:hypothetical protein
MFPPICSFAIKNGIRHTPLAGDLLQCVLQRGAVLNTVKLQKEVFGPKVDPVLVSRFQRNNVSAVCEKRAFNHMQQSRIQSNEVPLIVVEELLILVVVDEVDIDNQWFVLSV